MVHAILEILHTARPDTDMLVVIMKACYQSVTEACQQAQSAERTSINLAGGMFATSLNVCPLWFNSETMCGTHPRRQFAL